MFIKLDDRISVKFQLILIVALISCVYSAQLQNSISNNNNNNNNNNDDDDNENLMATKKSDNYNDADDKQSHLNYAKLMYFLRSLFKNRHQNELDSQSDYEFDTTDAPANLNADSDYYENHEPTDQQFTNLKLKRFDKYASPVYLKKILLNSRNNNKNILNYKRDCHLGLGMGYLCHAYSITKFSQHQKLMSSPRGPGRK